MKVIKAIYNFIVGDMVILIGVLVIVAVLALFKFVPALTSLEVASGCDLVVGVLGVLAGFAQPRDQTQTLTQNAKQQEGRVTSNRCAPFLLLCVWIIRNGLALGLRHFWLSGR